MFVQSIRDYFERRRRSKARKLFSFFDGQRMRRVDPMECYLQFELHPEFDWDGTGRDISNDVPEAYGVAHRACCEVFGVRPWNPQTETGLTAAELETLLMEFVGYIEEVKKNMPPGLTSPSPTEPASTDSTAPPPETSKPPSDCFSTSIEPNCDPLPA